MRLTAEDLQDCVREMVTACPFLEQVDLLPILDAAQAGVQEALRGIEGRIEEAGTLPDDATASLVSMGAAYELASQLPGDRGKAVEAGRALGRLIAKGYSRKIAEAIATPGGRPV